MKRTIFYILVILHICITNTLGQWTVGYNTVHEGSASLESVEPKFIFNKLPGGSPYSHIFFESDSYNTDARFSYNHSTNDIEIGEINEVASFKMRDVSNVITDSPSDHGTFIIGKDDEPSASFLSFDNNEIQARQGALFSKLWLNYRGGDVSIGNDGLNYIDASNSVGIGTHNTYSYKVAIQGDVNENNVLKLDADDPRLQFNDGPERLGYIQSLNDNMYYINEKDGNSHFGNNLTTQMTLDNEGYLGIGAYTPLAPLHVAKDNGELLRLENSTTDYASMAFYHADERKALIVNTDDQMFYINNSQEGNTFIGNRGLPQMIIDVDGKVGIGNFYPSSQLDVAGDGNFTGELTAASDLKLKKNIRAIEEANAIISELNPVYYNFKTDKYPSLELSDKKRWGLIAQEVEQVLPELISTQTFVDTSGTPDEYLSVNYIDLIPIMLKAFQENQNQIEALKSKVETLKK